MNLTTKQRALLDIIGRKNTDGTEVDLNQILEGLPYRTSKESLQFSLRALTAHGLIEKRALEARRGRYHRPICLTPLGEHWRALMCLPGPSASAGTVMPPFVPTIPGPNGSSLPTGHTFMLDIEDLISTPNDL